jgi:undecaprenyl diphosphate synthase
MDGNGRWASRRGMPREAGHRAGVAAVRRIVHAAPTLGIRCLTLYAFSSDNWRRPAQEVSSIFELMRAYLRLETRRLTRSSVRLKIIGRRDRIPEELRREFERAERRTFRGLALDLRIAVDYSSRDAITGAAARATNALCGTEPVSSELLRDRITETLFESTGEVDLLIRTGGEKRLSDFLLWECAYAELWFTDRMWPDFGVEDLFAALEEYRHRERRFGGLATPTANHASSPMGGGE